MLGLCKAIPHKISATIPGRDVAVLRLYEIRNDHLLPPPSSVVFAKEGIRIHAG